jgi:bifunctional DNA-binding transcriptional regulator/antitoxin component of YhaV-PrlF toxin-antitoxin module
MNTMEVSRRVNEKRRVGLPMELAVLSGIRPRVWVTVGLADDRRWALVLTPVPAPDDPGAAARRDPVRPRMVSEVMQVTLPKLLRERVGMKPDDWVFVSSLGQDRGMRVVPQAKVMLRELPTARAGRFAGRGVVTPAGVS